MDSFFYKINLGDEKVLSTVIRATNHVTRAPSILPLPARFLSAAKQKRRFEKTISRIFDHENFNNPFSNTICTIFQFHYSVGDFKTL